MQMPDMRRTCPDNCFLALMPSAGAEVFAAGSTQTCLSATRAFYAGCIGLQERCNNVWSTGDPARSARRGRNVIQKVNSRPRHATRSIGQGEELDP